MTKQLLERKALNWGRLTEVKSIIIKVGVVLEGHGTGGTKSSTS